VATPAYDRILLKLSGEAFAGPGGTVDVDTTTAMAREIAQLHVAGISTAVVVGGGNIWRGKIHEAAGMERATADYMGMLATVINALALQDSLERIGVPSRGADRDRDERDRRTVHPAPRDAASRKRPGRDLCGRYRQPVLHHRPRPALRAVEVGARAILKATKVDGVYSADPFKDPTATRFTQLDYLRVLELDSR